jgi:integrase
MRRAEIARLKIADIDSQRMVLHVVNGKGGKDRDLPLSRMLLETLRAHWRWLKPQTCSPHACIATAKTFSWKNYEFVTSEEDRKQEVPMTPGRRWVLIGYSCPTPRKRSNWQSSTHFVQKLGPSRTF